MIYQVTSLRYGRVIHLSSQRIVAGPKGFGKIKTLCGKAIKDAIYSDSPRQTFCKKCQHNQTAKE